MVVGGAGSGVRELTNQRRLSIGEGLKETGACQTEGGYRAAALDSMRKLMHIISCQK